jgi:molybdenum cofactor biosynthesis enzyme MoaA
MSEPTKDKQTMTPVKTCALCSHMRMSNRGKTAECDMRAKGMHSRVIFHRKPSGEFDTFAWLKARDCDHYDGDEEMLENEAGEA